MTPQQLTLLQLAADACGLLYDPTRTPVHALWVVHKDADDQGDQYPWNPLVNDSQRHEMAHQLKIHADSLNRLAWGACSGEVIVAYWGPVARHLNEAEAVLHVAAELGRRKT